MVSFRHDRLSKNISGGRVMLYREKNSNQVYVTIPNKAAEAVLAVPPMSETEIPHSMTNSFPSVGA